MSTEKQSRRNEQNPKILPSQRRNNNEPTPTQQSPTQQRHNASHDTNTRRN